MFGCQLINHYIGVIINGNMAATTTPQFQSLVELNDYFSDEYTCRQHLAQIRWKGTPVCPRCGCEKSYLFKYSGPAFLYQPLERVGEFYLALTPDCATNSRF